MARMRSEERRRQLLEVSAKLFAQCGYRGTTTAELAKAASVTEPILYRHFDNKLDLFVTLVEEIGTEVIDAWEQALNGIRNPEERLSVLLASNPATHDRGVMAYRVIFQAMTEIERDPAIAKPLRKHLSRMHTFISDELKSLQASGTVRKDETPEALAWMLINIGVGYGMTLPLGLNGHNPVSSKKAMQSLLHELLGSS